MPCDCILLIKLQAMTIPFIFQQISCVLFLILLPECVPECCESSAWTHVQMHLFLLRLALFVFAYWILSGTDNGEMGLLILSAHGAMTAHSSFALMGQPISNQLMQEVVVWGWRSTGSSVQLLWRPTRTESGSGVACLRPIHMLSA